MTVLLDDVDHERLAGRRISIGSHGYAQLWEPALGRTLLLHRWVKGAIDRTGYAFLVDHENRNRLDCRRSNLRTLSPSQSNLNREVGARPLPTGVYLRRSGRFGAQVKRNGVTYYCGTWNTIAEASAAREVMLLGLP